MKKIFLIFPNKLCKIKRQFIEINHITLIQDSLFFGSDTQCKQKFHCQKIISHKATMNYYEQELKKQHHNIIHINHKRETRTEDNLYYLLV